MVFKPSVASPVCAPFFAVGMGKANNKQPLFFLSAKSLTAQDPALLFEKLTGRKPNEEEMAEVEKTLAQRKLSCHSHTPRR